MILETMHNYKKPIVVHISSWHTKWVIGGIFREAAEAISLKFSWRIYPTSRNDLLRPEILKSRIFPNFGDLNVYAHQDTYFNSFASDPKVVKKNRNRVFFTHFSESYYLTESQVNSLQYCERIMVQNEYMENHLTKRGVPKNRIKRAPGAVNRLTYQPCKEKPKVSFVLFSGDFKYRKNPGLISQVIENMPGVNFIVHGRNWDIFPSKFLSGYPNLKRLDFNLDNQPNLIRQASLYVSLSLIEGGPYSVLEALASGTPVVATDAGFCSEFISEKNGKLLPNPPDIGLVTSAITNALKMKDAVWDKDLLNGRWQWKDLGEIIYR